MNNFLKIFAILNNKINNLKSSSQLIEGDVEGLKDEVDKLKLLQNSITIGLSSDTTTTVTSAYSSVDLNFNSEISKTGTLLTFESGKIKIGKGIKKIIASTKVQTQGDNSTWGINILKNGSAIASSFEGNQGAGWCQLAITPFEIPVTENDLISVNVYHNVANSTKTIKSYQGGGTYLTIQVIE